MKAATQQQLDRMQSEIHRLRADDLQALIDSKDAALRIAAQNIIDRSFHCNQSLLEVVHEEISIVLGL